MVDMSAYRSREIEQTRVASLLGLLPDAGSRVLDVGARDGYLSTLLADRFEEVIALDLERPLIDHPRITPVRGDVTRLDYPAGYFDATLCAEVLEHVPCRSLATACREIVRVSAGPIVIGVPYRQDLRLGRTTCSACGETNPPWGHVNSFDETRLRNLFEPARTDAVEFVGKTRERTNAVSALFMNLAGNPYGTYEQEEPCVHCGKAVGSPRQRNLLQKVVTRLAVLLQSMQSQIQPWRGNWIHMRFQSAPAGD